MQKNDMLHSSADEYEVIETRLQSKRWPLCHYMWNKTFKLLWCCESFGKLVLYGRVASSHKFSEKLRKWSDTDLLNPALERCGETVSETVQQAVWTGYKSTLSLLFQLWFFAIQLTDTCNLTLMNTDNQTTIQTEIRPNLHSSIVPGILMED